MQCSHPSSPLLSLHAILAEDRHRGGAKTSVNKELFSVLSKTCQPHTLLPADTFLSCSFQEVWPSASILSLVMNCIWIMAAPPSSYLPRQLESLHPVFLLFFYFYTSSTLIFCKWLVFADWTSLKMLKELATFVEETSLEHKNI